MVQLAPRLSGQIKTQSKVDHFQFWILHSIESQMNMLSRRLGGLSERVEGMETSPGDRGVKEPASTEES